MYIYVLTSVFDADSSEDVIEKLVAPKEKELLLTYIEVVALYLGLIKKNVPAKDAAPKIVAARIMISAFCQRIFTT